MGLQGVMGLPKHIDQVSLLLTPELAKGRLYAVVTPDPKRGSFDAEIVDAAGNRCMQLTGYGTVALPNAVDAEGLKELRARLSARVVAAA